MAVGGGGDKGAEEGLFAPDTKIFIKSLLFIIKSSNLVQLIFEPYL